MVLYKLFIYIYEILIRLRPLHSIQVILSIFRIKSLVSFNMICKIYRPTRAWLFALGIKSPFTPIQSILMYTCPPIIGILSFIPIHWLNESTNNLSSFVENGKKKKKKKIGMFFFMEMDTPLYDISGPQCESKPNQCSCITRSFDKRHLQSVNSIWIMCNA